MIETYKKMYTKLEDLPSKYITAKQVLNLKSLGIDTIYDLIYCNKYNKKFGFGDLIAYMMPHAIIILITSIIFFGVWLMFNLPIGFNTVNFF